MYDHYHTHPYAGIATAVTARTIAGETVLVSNTFNSDIESCIATGATRVSTEYRDRDGNTYDVDEMINLLYDINDRLKRLENYYIGQKLEALLTSDDEERECS